MIRLITVITFVVSLLIWTVQISASSPCASLCEEFMVPDDGCDSGCSGRYWYCLIPGHRHPAGKPCPILGHCFGKGTIGQQLGLGSAGANGPVSSMVEFCANQPPLFHSEKNLNAAKRRIKNNIYSFRTTISSITVPSVRITVPSVRDHSRQANVSESYFDSQFQTEPNAQSEFFAQNRFGGVGSAQKTTGTSGLASHEFGVSPEKASVPIVPPQAQHTATVWQTAPATIPIPVGPPPHGVLDGIFAVQKYQRVQPMVLGLSYPTHGLPPGYAAQGYGYYPPNYATHGYPQSYIPQGYGYYPPNYATHGYPSGYAPQGYGYPSGYMPQGYAYPSGYGYSPSYVY